MPSDWKFKLRVFAYYATPGTLAGDPAKDKNLPGIVLVHGGGGKAFAEWAECGPRGAMRQSRWTFPEQGAKENGSPTAARTKLVKAELHYTLDPLPETPKTRQWSSQPADIGDGRIRSNPPPENTTIGFLSVEDERKSTVSSELAFPNRDGW